MTPDQVAELFLATAAKFKADTDKIIGRSAELEGAHNGTYLGLTRGAEKLREALGYTGDLEQIAAGLVEFAAAYMGELKNLEILTPKERAFHKGVKYGLETVAQMLREAIVTQSDIMDTLGFNS